FLKLSAIMFQPIAVCTQQIQIFFLSHPVLLFFHPTVKPWTLPPLVDTKTREEYNRRGEKER
ncbi:MAG: hypothetical protein LBH35_03625, partial [Treponema sp.]|nr:hypothetical protein [Treponema sp.]